MYPYFKIPKPSFMPDEDNIIPILELDWFEDDITSRVGAVVGKTDTAGLATELEDTESPINLIETFMKSIGEETTPAATEKLSAEVTETSASANAETKETSGITSIYGKEDGKTIEVVEESVQALVEKEEVDLKYYSIIYNLIDDVKSAMSGMLSPDVQEKITGVALVQEVFRSSKLGSIAGCKVEDGAVKRNLPIRVLRDNIVIYEGELESLRRFKDVVTEVKQGVECGIGVKNYNDIKAGDRKECYEKITVARFLA